MRNGKEKPAFFAICGFRRLDGMVGVGPFSYLLVAGKGVCAHRCLIYVKKNTDLGEKGTRSDCGMKNSSYLCIVERKKREKAKEMQCEL